MNKYLLTIFYTFICISCTEKNNNGIKIEWINDLEGDFSFANEWSYPEWIFRNEHGQLVCDGFCPPEINEMKDDSGKIYTTIN